MTEKETNEVLDAVLKGTEVALAAQVLTALATVKAMTPGTHGEEAKVMALHELLELVLTGVQLVQKVTDESGEAMVMAELGEKFNERLSRVNTRIDTLLAMGDEEYGRAIPEESRKSLLSALKDVREGEQRMEQFAKFHGKMLIEQKKHKGSRIVEPIPGVLMLQAKKDPWDVIGRSPEVVWHDA